MVSTVVSGNGNGNCWASLPMVPRIPSTARQRVAPLEPWETSEVVVGRAKFATVLEGHGREVGVGDEIAGCVAVAEHLLEKAPVMLGGMEQPDTGLIQPTLDTIESLIQRQWALVQARVGGNSDESRQHQPAKSQGFRAGELFVPPRAGRRVVGGKTVLGIEQQVRIDENH